MPEERYVDVENMSIPTAFPSALGLDCNTQSSKTSFDVTGEEDLETLPLPQTHTQIPHSENGTALLDLSFTQPDSSLRSRGFTAAPEELRNLSSVELNAADVEVDNFLSVNVLLEIESSSGSLSKVSWDTLEVELQVVQRSAMPPETPHSQPACSSGSISVTAMHTCIDSELIQIEGTDCHVLQKSLEIHLPPVTGAPELSFFDVNMTFNETKYTGDWKVTASCYVGLHSARKVLYPIRCSFVRAFVDITGQVPTFYCSFAVRRYAKRRPENESAMYLNDELTHEVPEHTSLKRQFISEGNAINDGLASAQPLRHESPNLRSSSSHGMRPIGPNGRLMTAAQRTTFASIRKRFANTAARDWKTVLLDSDLYPLFTLGRDECAKEMGTCPTWLKVRMRERGIKVWPNRKLIPTTSGLYRLKQQRTEATRRYDVTGGSDVAEDLQRIDKEIAHIRTLRTKIIQESCSPQFYAAFISSTPITILDPDWEC